MAGGAVRDLLMNIRPSDIDFATDATPSQMKEIFEKNAVRIFNKNGEGHGTVSCRIDDKENFEITTLRIDVICDGRRAKVEFTTDWEKDANRRDLTVNSLFLDLDGTVIDYFGGIRDIENRRVVFVGDAVTRIQEDYLRILRYFRFFGRISHPGSAHDKDCIEAIVANRDGLSGISGERIWTELKKICVGRLADEILKVMIEDCGLAPYLGLPTNIVMKKFTEIFKHSSGNVMPMTVLTSFFANRDDLEVFHKRCKLSNAELSLGDFIIDMRDKVSRENWQQSYFKEALIDLERAPDRDKKKLEGHVLVTELAKYCLCSSDIIDELKSFVIPVFPISGIDLIKMEIPGGPFMREALKHLYKIWKTSNYVAKKEELLSHVSEVSMETAFVRSKKRGKRKFSDTRL